MAITWLTEPVEVTPSVSGSWQDVDVSAYLPAGTTGVILHIVTNTSTSYGVGVRNNGSSDNYNDSMQGLHHNWFVTGCDANRIFECYVGNTTGVDVWLVGGFGPEASFFVNAINKTPAQTGQWVDIDISADTGSETATAACWFVRAGTYEFGLRCNGSTDECYRRPLGPTGFLVPVDEQEICEGKIASTSIVFYLVGYVKSDLVTYVNGQDYSVSTLNAWTDMPTMPSDATGGFFEVRNTGATSFYCGLRPDGSSEDIVQQIRHTVGMVKATDAVTEGYITDANIDFFLLAYAVAAGQIQYGDASLYPLCSVEALGSARMSGAAALFPSSGAELGGSFRGAASLLIDALSGVAAAASAYLEASTAALAYTEVEASALAGRLAEASLMATSSAAMEALAGLKGEALLAAESSETATGQRWASGGASLIAGSSAALQALRQVQAEAAIMSQALQSGSAQRALMALAGIQSSSALAAQAMMAMGGRLSVVAQGLLSAVGALSELVAVEFRDDTSWTRFVDVSVWSAFADE